MFQLREVSETEVARESFPDESQRFGVTHTHYTYILYI